MKYTIDDIKEAFGKEDYILLSMEYTNNTQKLEYSCPKGHKHSISWKDWKSKGARCPYCNGRSIYTIQEIKSLFEKEGYKLLTTEYINNKQKLNYICPKGHSHSISFSSWLRGRRCYLCNGNLKKTIADVYHAFLEEGYTLISTSYSDCHKKLQALCPRGHSYNVTWDNWNHSGSRCPICSTGKSKTEEQILSVVEKISNSPVISRDREVCKPKELDIIIPDKKIAVEYCGLFWHSELAGKDKNYHFDKLKTCQDKGYRLITIFEDEWLTKQEIVEFELNTIINKQYNIKIYAKDCIIKRVSLEQAQAFWQENHLQEYNLNSTTGLGLFYDNELLTFMSFAPIMFRQQEIRPEGSWELCGLCVKMGYQIVGGATRLLNYFESHYNWSKIVSYADLRWSIGYLYQRLGFKLTEITSPKCWYIDKLSRLNKPQLSKKQKYNRIWDCGSIKFVKYNNL